MRISYWSSDVCSSVLSSWIQMWGEKDAWAFMDALDKNIAVYTHSGSKPCKQAAAGEYVIGISFDYRGAKSKSAGAPIEVIAPDEGLGWELEAFAIVKNTDKLDAAKKFADWSVSRAANERSEEHTSELQSLMRISYAVFCLKKKK